MQVFLLHHLNRFYLAINVKLQLTFLCQFSNVDVRQSGPLSQFLSKCRLPYARSS